jgi:hypothetical protein
MDGLYWNESYFLRAFLSYNSEWSIRFFNSYVHFMFGELTKEKMPLCAKDHGGSYTFNVSRMATNKCRADEVNE